MRFVQFIETMRLKVGKMQSYYYKTRDNSKSIWSLVWLSIPASAFAFSTRLMQPDAEKQTATTSTVITTTIVNVACVYNL